MTRQDISEIIIGTDAGREGELVARWIINKCQVKKPLKRLWISSVTDKAIRQGFANLKDGKAYKNLYHSAVARAECDWLVGINGTRALTTKYNTSLSCGRVQTPTLAMILEREKNIVAFKPKKYYGIDMQTTSFTGKWYKNNQTRVFDETYVDETLNLLKGKEAVVTDVQKKTKKSYPQPLYDLTELQRDAFKLYQFSPKKTLGLMQKLYESHKALTYPRTDSRYLTDDMLPTIKDRLNSIRISPYRETAFKLTKQRIASSKHFIDNKKVSDHHAIIPTEEPVNVTDFSFEERKIYELVVKRFVEVLMPPYEYEETAVEVMIEKELFKSKFNRTLSLGYKSMDAVESKQTHIVVKKGDVLQVRQCIKTSGQTEPPKYFNEASLLSAMENPSAYMSQGEQELKKTLTRTGGLGTVATRADIIEKLYNTELIENKHSTIHITNKGKQLLNVAPEDLRSPLLTAQWEMKLEKIAKGQMNYHDFIKDMKRYTIDIVNEINGSKKTFKHDNITSTKCPECGQLMMRKKSKHGESLVCQDRECNHRISVSRVTNARCPECHKKMELKGSGDKKIFTCKCGYRERLSAFEKRKSSSNRSGGKKDYIQYMKKQEKESQEKGQNPFAALSNLNLKK